MGLRTQTPSANLPQDLEPVRVVHFGGLDYHALRLRDPVEGFKRLLQRAHVSWGASVGRCTAERPLRLLRQPGPPPYLRLAWVVVRRFSARAASLDPLQARGALPLQAVQAFREGQREWGRIEHGLEALAAQVRHAGTLAWLGIDCTPATTAARTHS